MPVILVPPRRSSHRRHHRRPRCGLYLCLALGTGFLLWAAVFIWHSSVVGYDGVRRFCLFDDAMIALRYGWNVAHGAGAVWNPGENPRVEGYTTPLLVGLMAIAARLCPADRSAAVLLVQLAGIPLVLLNAWTLRQVAREALLLRPAEDERTGRIAGASRESHGREDRAGRHDDALTLETLAFAAGLVFYPLLYWTLLGMETGPLALLLSASVLLTLKFAHLQSCGRPALGLGLALAATLALAYLARPDAALFAALAFGYLLFGEALFPHPHEEAGGGGSRRRAFRRRLRALLAPAALYAAVLVVHLLWRRAYYGEWLPNTYVLKMAGLPLGFRLVNGLHYLAPFLVACRWLGLLLAAGLLLDFRREKLFLAAFPLTMAAYQIYVGGDPWDLWRQVAPTVPLALLLAAHELLRLARALVPATTAVSSATGEGTVAAADGGSDGSGSWRDYLDGPRSLLPPAALVPLLAVGALTALVLAPLNAPYRREILGLSPPAYTDANAYDVNVGVALREVTTPEARVGAAALGAIAYYSERLGATQRGPAGKVRPARGAAGPGPERGGGLAPDAERARAQQVRLPLLRRGTPTRLRPALSLGRSGRERVGGRRPLRQRALPRCDPAPAGRLAERALGAARRGGALAAVLASSDEKLSGGGCRRRDQSMRKGTAVVSVKVGAS